MKKRTKARRTRRADPTTSAAHEAADATQQFEQRHEQRNATRVYTLRLFVTGNSPRSTAAIATIRAVCDTYLAGHFELEVVDLYQQPTAAANEQIIAAPTLIKQHPAPVRRLVGSLADRERVLAGLDIHAADPHTAAGTPPR